jgi:hypothetical protein
MSTPNKIHLGPNLRGRISQHRYDLTNLVYMTNADMVDWINFRVNLKKERFIPALMLALTKELDGI